MQLGSRQLDLLFGTFFDITSSIHAGRERSDIFARVLDCCCELLEADTSLLVLVQGGHLQRFWKAPAESSLVQAGELPETQAVLEWMERERLPFVGPPGEWRLPVPPPPDLERGSGSVMCAPLVAKESHLGLLVAVRSKRPGGFDTNHLKILAALAHQTAIAIESADLYERLKQEAVTDGLTGVYNYKTLMQTLRTELRRAQRHGNPLAFVMADVDYLKRYNDRFGHMAGSEVLAQVAALLTSNCRNTDIVGKYGGDEFAIILPQTGVQGAMAVGERVRAAIAAHRFANVELGEITCSFGIAAFPEDGAEPHTLICEADQQLFQAKRAGKNTICATRHSPGEAPPAAAPVAEAAPVAGATPAAAPAAVAPPAAGPVAAPTRF